MKDSHRDSQLPALTKYAERPPVSLPSRGCDGVMLVERCESAARLTNNLATEEKLAVRKKTPRKPVG